MVLKKILKASLIPILKAFWRITQNYLWKETELHEKLIDVMLTSFEEIWTISQKQNCDLRTAALIKGIKRVAAAKLTRGLFP